MQQQFIAIEIKDLEIASVATAILPSIGELPFQEVRNHFLVLGFPEEGKFALVPPSAFNDNFKLIENGPFLRMKIFTRK